MDIKSIKDRIEEIRIQTEGADKKMTDAFAHARELEREYKELALYMSEESKELVDKLRELEKLEG